MPNTLYVLELRDIGGDVPVECRLRSALKHLLRFHRLRCTSVRLAEPIIAAKAKAQQGKRNDIPQISAKGSAKPIDTRAELAKSAGVSHDTIAPATAGPHNHVEQAATISADPQEQDAPELQLLEKTTPTASANGIDPSGRR